MPPLWIVEALDVVEHIGLGLVACAVRLARRSLSLQRREEAFHRRIVPDVARVALSPAIHPLSGRTGVRVGEVTGLVLASEAGR